MPSQFVKLGETEVHRGAIISVAVGRFRSPSGEEFVRDVVHHPGAVSVVPVTGDGTVMLVRQYRAAFDREFLEIPAGKRDIADEPPEVSAQRELVEEIGMRAGRLEKLCEFANSPGFCDEWMHVFLGRDLEEVGLDLQGVEEQHMTIERVALDDVPRLVASGDITDAKSIIGLLLTREHLAAGR